jgi:hypothetical protein
MKRSWEGSVGAWDGERGIEERADLISPPFLSPLILHNPLSLFLRAPLSSAG